MAILPLKSSCTLIIISRGAPLVLLVVAGHGGCCRIFGIWDNRLLIHPFWDLICGLLGWVPNIFISIWPAVFLGMALFTTIVTSYIWPRRWPSSRVTTISIAADLEINLLQSLVGLLFNYYSLCLRKLRLVLVLFFAGSWFPPLWIHKIAVFLRSLLYKGLVGYEVLLWYDIHVTHTKFLDKLRNLLVLLNSPQTEYGFRSILKKCKWCTLVAQAWSPLHSQGA